MFALQNRRGLPAPHYANRCDFLKMKTRHFLPRPSLAIALLLALTPSLRADGVSEMKSFSIFDSVDLAALAQGEAKAVRGAPMSTSRFLSVQTAWVSAGSPAQVAAALARWSPAGSSELKVLLHQTGSNFSRLAQAPNNAPVQALVSATTSKSPALQLSKAEAAKLPDAAAGSTLSGAVANFWSGVLSGRAQAFSSGGLSGQPPYDYSAQAIRPGAEINSLLNEQGKIKKQFSGILSAKAEQYWELVDVDGKGVLTLGTSYSRSVSGGSYQAADVLYYASGGYYVAVTLYQMWPVELNGKPATLVWRGDMISSAELAGLAGVERLGSESVTIKDVSRAVRIFRRDSGGSR